MAINGSAKYMSSWETEKRAIPVDKSIIIIIIILIVHMVHRTKRNSLQKIINRFSYVTEDAEASGTLTDYNFQMHYWNYTACRQQNRK